MHKPSLAEALKPHDRTAATTKAETPPTRRGKTSLPPSRAGKKALIGYFDPEVSKQLKQMLLDQDRDSVQELLREALNDLFKKYRKPSIA
jgi:hypothetical protein